MTDPRQGKNRRRLKNNLTLDETPVQDEQTLESVIRYYEAKGTSQDQTDLDRLGESADFTMDDNFAYSGHKRNQAKVSMAGNVAANKHQDTQVASKTKSVKK
jgi:hypothetical protein